MSFPAWGAGAKQLQNPLVLGAVGGSAATLLLLFIQQWLTSPTKKKKPFPSFLELMYLSKNGPGPGEPLESTPKKDAFRMPAEWEPHDGCWLLFPHRLDNWRDGAAPAQKAYAAVANAIAKHGNEKVTVAVRSEDWSKARALLDSQVRVVEIRSDDSWVRDTGPTFVVKDEDGERTIRGVDWGFNAYGGENGGAYDPWDQDELVARKVLEMEGVHRYKAPLIMEGGSFHVDGEGTCLVTEETLLNPNRNPNLTKEQIEGYLKEYLNVQKVIWLEYGVVNDEDTNGHVDNFACFKAPGEVLLHWTDDKDDPQFVRSLDAFNRLSLETDAKGRKFRVHKIPMPGPIYYKKSDIPASDHDDDGHAVGRAVGQRMAASYINFYIANEAVILPQFGDRKDDEALELFQMLFPDRKVVGVQTREILLGGGNIHCITQQQPALSLEGFV